MSTNELTKYCSGIVVLTDAVKEEIAALVVRGNEITQVTNDSEARTAGNLVRDAKSLMKVADNERKNVTRVLDAAKKRITADVEAPLAPIKAMLERVSGLAESYVAEQKRKAEEANEAALQEAAIAAEFGETVAPPPEAAPVKVGGVRSRETWDFEVVASDEVPRAYCSPDPKLVRDYIHSSREAGVKFDDLFIPGLKFIKKTTVY